MTLRTVFFLTAPAWAHVCKHLQIYRGDYNRSRVFTLVFEVICRLCGDLDIQTITNQQSQGAGQEQA